MKRIFLLLILAAVLVTVADEVFALPDGEEIIAATGGFRFAAINASGPEILDAWADGTATIYFVKSTDGVDAAPNGAARKWPSGEVYGNTAFALRTATARPFHMKGDGADSCYVVLGTATEVILTWTND